MRPRLGPESNREQPEHNLADRRAEDHTVKSVWGGMAGYHLGGGDCNVL